MLAPVENGELQDDEEDNDHRNAGGFDLGSFLAQMMPMFQMVMAQRNGGNAKASHTRNAAAAIDDDEDYDEEAGGGDDGGDEDATNDQAPAPSADMETPGPDAMAHFAAIQSQLTPDEAQLAQAVASELAPQQINGWIAELSRVSVDDAVALIRETIRKSSECARNGGAS